SPIKRLPPELMLLIVDYVPVVSGASLSLTSVSRLSQEGWTFDHTRISLLPRTRPSNPRRLQGLICCDHCYTEFRVDFKSYGKAGNAMFLTRWMDLGEGRDFNDHKFRSRL
ncbi:hypothetical protein DL98DRAFT_353100, partial [Cadophora sp. DSE1049]